MYMCMLYQTLGHLVWYMCMLYQTLGHLVWYIVCCIKHWDIWYGTCVCCIKHWDIWLRYIVCCIKHWDIWYSTCVCCIKSWDIRYGTCVCCIKSWDIWYGTCVFCTILILSRFCAQQCIILKPLGPEVTPPIRADKHYVWAIQAWKFAWRTVFINNITWKKAFRFNHLIYQFVSNGTQSWQIIILKCQSHGIKRNYMKCVSLWTDPTSVWYALYYLCLYRQIPQVWYALYYLCVSMDRSHSVVCTVLPVCLYGQTHKCGMHCITCVSLWTDPTSVVCTVLPVSQ